MLRVVTPTLGASAFLPLVIANVRALGVPHEHILACPASRVDELRAKYPGLLVIVDAGAAGGMYGAVECGRNWPGDFDWFTYINDDDLLGVEFTDYYRRVSTGECRRDLHFGRVDLINEQGQRVGEISRCRSSGYLRGVFASRRSPFNQQGALISRAVFSAVGGFDLKYRFAGDWEFFSRCLHQGITMTPHDLRVGCFRCHAEQLSHQSMDFDREIEDVRLRYWRQVAAGERRWAGLRFLWDNKGIYLSRILRGWGLTGRRAMRPPVVA